MNVWSGRNARQGGRSPLQRFHAAANPMARQITANVLDNFEMQPASP